MNTENKSPEPRLGVLAEICARLAAITPEQFVVPEVARSKDATFVCTATDDIKRLFTLRNQLVDEMEELAKSGMEAALEALGDLGSRNPLIVAKELTTPGSRTWELQAGMRTRSGAMRQKDHLCEIVDEILWLEIRRQHPDLQDKPAVAIFSDWGLYWLKEIPDDRAGFDIGAGLELLASLGRQQRAGAN